MNHLDQYISDLMVVGLYFFIFIQTVIEHCKQILETLIRRRGVRRLILVCTVCLRPTKRTPGLYGLTATFQLLHVITIRVESSVDPDQMASSEAS